MKFFTKKKKTSKTKSKPKSSKSKSLPVLTPINVLKLKPPINNKTLTIAHSYRPTINKQLVSLKTIDRPNLKECNTNKAFQLKETLQIKVNGKCYPYQSSIAQEELLNRLRMNKHINPKKMITPIQSLSNCWFNTMFVAFFMSDKGRQFFHFFRQLMIEGVQANGNKIPPEIWDSFSLLNFAIEACLTGNKYAYVLDTNNIIKHIYKSIPDSYKKSNSYLVDVDYANNPIYYYNSLMNYLNANTLSSYILSMYDNGDWKAHLEGIITEQFIPHYIVFEIFDGAGQTPGVSGLIKSKQQTFKIGPYEYSLDSCIIRDIEQQHFTAVLSCEGKEMAYDGASFHRIVPMVWKSKINTDYKWNFKGTDHEDGRPYYWSFTHGYQMLFYYRTK